MDLFDFSRMPRALLEHGSVLNHHGKPVGQCRERSLLDDRRRCHSFSRRVWQVARGRGARHHRGPKSQIQRGTCRRADTHVSRKARDDDVAAAGSADALWGKIGVGSVVLAEQPEVYGPGWWEGVVVGVTGDELTIRWMDDATEEPLRVSRRNVALRHPGAG